MDANETAIQYYKNSKPSYCPNCKTETKTFWNGLAACCENCKRSYPEMKEECEKLGISSAGHWDLCLSCNSWERWDERGQKLRCVKCHKTIGEAFEVEKARPDRITFSPEPHFNNEKIDLTFWLADSTFPIFISINWSGSGRGCMSYYMISDESIYQTGPYYLIKIKKEDVKTILVLDLPYKNVTHAEIVVISGQSKRKKIRLNNQISLAKPSICEKLKIILKKMFSINLRKR